VGALKGSISFSKFHVRGELPESLHAPFMKSLRAQAFRPLEVTEEEDERAGWCAIQDPFDLELGHEKVFFNEYLNVGLRVDRWMIPKPLFRAHFAEAERVHLEKRGRDKLSRREKDELKVFVSRRLRKQVIPAMRVFDLSWNLTSGVVRFWNNASKNHDRLMELFQATFHLELVPDGPYVAATHAGLSAADRKKLDDVEPMELVEEMV
jgi:hypothetical protein